MEIKMKAVSNMAAALALVIVMASFVLNALGLARINIMDAVIVGGFTKAVFLPVDASIWIHNIFGARGSGGGIVQRDYEDNR